MANPHGVDNGQCISAIFGGITNPNRAISRADLLASLAITGQALRSSLDHRDRTKESFPMDKSKAELSANPARIPNIKLPETAPKAIP
jgi:hypothetical protein